MRLVDKQDTWKLEIWVEYSNYLDMRVQEGLPTFQYISNKVTQIIGKKSEIRFNSHSKGYK